MTTPPQPDRTKAPDIKSLPHLHLPSPRRIALDCGAELIVTDGGADEVNRLTVLFQGGIAESSRPWLPKLAMQTLCEGTSTLSSEEVADALDRNGSWFGPGCYHHHVGATMFSLNRNMDKVLPVFGEMISSPAFPEREIAIASESAARQLEIEMEKPSWHANNAMRRAAMGATHPLARTSEPDDIRSVTSAMLSEFHKGVFVPSGMKVFLGGRITPAIEDKVASMIEQAASAAQSAPLQPIYLPFNTSTGLEIATPVEGAVQNSVSMCLPAPLRSDSDYIPLRIAVMALGGYFGSRLMKVIREEKGLTYGISASLNGLKEGSFISIDAETDPRYVEELVEETRRQLRRMWENPLDPEELQRLVGNYRTQLAARLESPLSLTQELITEQVAAIPTDYFEDQQTALDTLTSAQIARISQQWLNPDLLTVSVAGRL